MVVASEVDDSKLVGKVKSDGDQEVFKELVEAIKTLLDKSDVSENELQSKIDEFTKLMKSMGCSSKGNHFEKIREILTPVQQAKLIVFHQEFRGEMHRKMGNMGKHKK